MKFIYLKNALISLVAIFSLLLIISAIGYVSSEAISPFVKQSLTLIALCTLIVAAHFWATSHENSTGIQKFMIYILYGEMIASALVSAVMIYGHFSFYKMVILLLAFQGVHLAIYLCYMFLYDEKPIQQVSLTDEEILERSTKKTISPPIQE